MSVRSTAQDVMRCDLCETSVVQMHCDTCLVNLCTACVGKHMIDDESKKHEIVSFRNRTSTIIYPRCKSHDERCEMYCDQCNIKVCTSDIVSEKHSGHKILKILTIYNSRRKEIEKENEDLIQNIYPTYQAIAFDAQKRLSQLEKEYGDISTAITKHGEDWHREIDKIVNGMKAEVDERKASHRKTLTKHIAEINQRILDIESEISASTKLLESNDISQAFQFKGKVAEFRNLPSKVDESLPLFTPMLFQHERFSTQFGRLASPFHISEENGYSMKTTHKLSEDESSIRVKQQFDEPETVTSINTGYESLLYHVTCLNNDQIWTSGDDSSLKLFSTNQGSLLKSIATKSGNPPTDIAMSKSGDLIYTDCCDRTVNIAKNEQIEQVIRLEKWKPLGVCNTSSDDILVIMDSEDIKNSKVVRYSGSTEKQTIQFDDEMNQLYSSGMKYINENRNLDICVADFGAGAVVVVSEVGKLRFRYTGHTPAPREKRLSPRGITTDSQSHILTADDENHCVHIIDQDGQFLRYIVCGLSNPYGLCIDTNDNLYVAQYQNTQVKKIKYLQFNYNIDYMNVDKYALSL